MNRSLLLASSVLLPALALAALADGPADNIAEKVRPVPPPGVAVPDADRAVLQQGLADLGRQISALRGNRNLPDVQIYHNAVRYALQYGEFFNVGEIARAKALLATGQERARALAAGQTPWLTKPGPTALGYVSEIDGSVQPYGLSIPEGYNPNGAKKWRIDTWFHGRGETLSELNFIDSSQRSAGQFARPDFFVVNLYGRYCNANKLAGETDLFEALNDIKKRFKVDEDRVVVRGFSMGGAAAWQFAAHFASDWAAAAPGAGFSETPDFLKVYQKETLTPTPWEAKLWQMYDCPVYAPNLANVPLIAYSGEIDSQKQAADIMEKAMRDVGLTLNHVIGPNTGHSYHKDAIPVINDFVDKAAAKGRDRMPRKVRLATPTLKYNQQAWVTVDALIQHWERSTVDAEVVDDHTVSLKTNGVAALTLAMPAGLAPLAATGTPSIAIDGQKLNGPKVASDRSWTVHLQKGKSGWKVSKGLSENAVVKRHDLQGPIDDAYMESFMIVRPTGTPLAPGVSRWVDAELQHSITQWRSQFRGEPRIKNDVDISDADLAAHNLVLWGDPGSNRILAKIASKLPIRWNKDAVVVGKQSFPASTHAPVLIYPNPLNPKHYVVLNSGVTYREYDYLNNARQVPKLPDWAIVDTTTAPNSRYTGKIVTADFFGERWELKK